MGTTPVPPPVHQDLGEITVHSSEADGCACAGALSESSALRGRPQAAAYLEQLRKPFGAANSTSLTAVSPHPCPLLGDSMPCAPSPSCKNLNARQAMTHRSPADVPLSVPAFELVLSLHPGKGVLQGIPGG